MGESQAELKERIRDQHEAIRGKDRAEVSTDESGKAKPLGDYDATPSGTNKKKAGVIPKPEADFSDDGAPKRESFAAGLPGVAAYTAAKRAYEARQKPSVQKTAISNALKASK